MQRAARKASNKRIKIPPQSFSLRTETPINPDRHDRVGIIPSGFPDIKEENEDRLGKTLAGLFYILLH